MHCEIIGQRFDPSIGCKPISSVEERLSMIQRMLVLNPTPPISVMSLNYFATLAERSKAVHSSCTMFACTSSNLVGGTFF